MLISSYHMLPAHVAGGEHSDKEEEQEEVKNPQLAHPVLNHIMLHDEVINLQGRKNARLRN